MRRALALSLVVLLVLMCWYLSRRTTPATSDSRTTNRVTIIPTAPPAETPPPESASGRTSPASAQVGRTGTTVAASATGLSIDSFRDVIAANSVPGRMLFFDFVLDRGGLRLTAVHGAAGRAKPGGSRTGFGFVHYEAFGPGGDLLLAGSVEDPTRRRIEHPAASDDGRIENTVQFNDEGPLSVRLPGEIAAARIVFFRDKNPLAPLPQSRENLGEFILRPSP